MGNVTPLAQATFHNKPEAVSLLLTQGASLSSGQCADAGAARGSIAALQTLMTSPQWLAMNIYDRVQAESAVFHQVREIATLNALCSMVLDTSVPARFMFADGSNALHSAARHGKAVPLICALIKEGVDPAATNDAGQTPAEAAREAGHTLHATLLERAADDMRRRDLMQQQQQQQNED